MIMCCIVNPIKTLKCLKSIKMLPLIQTSHLHQSAFYWSSSFSAPKHQVPDKQHELGSDPTPHDNRQITTYCKMQTSPRSKRSLVSCIGRSSVVDERRQRSKIWNKCHIDKMFLVKHTYALKLNKQINAVRR